MNKEQWQNAIDELLDGSLGSEEAAALREAAENDAQLATAIIDAYQIQNELESLGLEQAPPSLQKRLRAIPAEQGRRSQPMMRWGALGGAMAALVMVIGLTQGPADPSQAEIERAHAELKVAFTYLGAIGQKTGLQMRQEIGGSMTNALYTGVREGVGKDQETS